ncbi:MAG: helix-hairpin-helix domain-containing protein [Lachnospiraceae bacterium]|nr:helix-hairpin-helix domain-containing protein [Candidatus Darwinimomas equi]
MKKIVKTVFIAVCFLLCGIIYSCGKTQTVNLDETGSAGSIENSDTEQSLSEECDDEPDTPAETQSETTEPESIRGIIVYVCGAVNNPGVYELNTGDRIIDAVETAGGFAGEADIDYLNLAETVGDGLKIYVPTEKEVEEGYSEKPVSASVNPSADSGSAGMAEKVNINTAQIEQLKTLKGVGDSRAKDIIEFRNTHGPFEKIEDIMLVPGIKNGMFEKIKDNIEV